MKRAMVLCGLLFVGGVSISLSGMQVTTGPTATSLAATKIEKNQRQPLHDYRLQREPDRSVRGR